MATERLPMRHIREILRLKWRLSRSHRETARSLGVSAGVVASVLSRASKLGLTWDAIEELADDALDQRLYGPRVTGRPARPLPDPAWLHTELRRVGVTLELLHLEYLQQYPDGYRYSAFCAHYRDWVERQRRSMRQVHKAGEKLFVDYSGKKPEIVDPATGVMRAVELFVAVLGASNYTYAEATETQRSADFIQSHSRTVEYLGGVPALIVPDQLKPGVRNACRYEPILQRTYEEWAAHYQTAILPARPGKPRDKAKVEVAVQVAQRWILARLRHETFFSLAALNARIRELLADLNARPMKGYGGAARLDLFTRFDQPALRLLPGERFVYTEWREARVNIDYHVDVEHHLYSVPHRLIHQTVDIRLSATMLEVFQRGTRIWVHRRSHHPGYTTVAEHMPHAHRAHLEWSPSRLIRWGATVGPHTAALIEQILASRPHPEQGYRSCLGLLRLVKQYGPERVEAASERAVAVGARSYRHVETILKHGLDRVPLEADAPRSTPCAGHANVRGPAYYQQELPHAD
jgi:transposase